MTVLIRKHARDLVLALLAAIAPAVLLYATNWGIGLSPDSASYIGGAMGIAQGKGYGFPVGGGVWSPIAVWPPMYSISLAVPIALAADPLGTARWLNAVLFGGNAVLVALLLRRIRGLHIIVPFAGAGFFLLNRDALSTHAWAWSEALFLFLGYLGLLKLADYLQAPTWRSLAVAAVCTGLAMITRYSGVAFFLTSVFGLITFPIREMSPFVRLKRALGFAALASIPIGLWFLRNALAAGPITGDVFQPQTIPENEWLGAYRIVYLWFMPGRIAGPLRMYTMILVGLLLLGSGLLVARWRKDPSPEIMTAGVVGTLGFAFLVIYSFVVIYSRLYVRRFPLDDPRQLLPTYPAVIMTLSAAGAIVTRRWTVPARGSQLSSLARSVLLPGGVLCGGYVLLMIYSFALHTGQWIMRSRADGLGYANESWRSSAIVQAVRDLPEDTPVISNAYDALLLLTRRETYPLPPSATISPPTGGLAHEWQGIWDLLQSHAGVVAYFTDPTRRGMVDEEQLTQAIPVCVALEAKEGRLYRACE